MRISVRWIGLISLIFVLIPTVRAQLSSSLLFSSGMVLQRNVDVPVWGDGVSGSWVKVELNGFKDSTLVGASGSWELTLPPLDAGGPYVLSLYSGTESLIYSDVYVGDVWLASGQSNMAMRLKDCENAAQEIAGSDNPEIRHFYVKTSLGNTPKETLPAGSIWTPATPDFVGEFTGVGYYFARYLQNYLGVPVGILNASFGGTRIESWMSEEMLGYDEQDIEFGDGTSWLQPTVAYNNMLHPLLKFPIKGVIWYQGESNMGNRETALTYTTQFKKLISSWRELWGLGEIPFFWVQIANTGNESNENSPGTWDALPMLRESQSRALSLPKTGEAISIDTGEPDIHPIRKEPVGERLSLLARSVCYGDSLIYSGPRYKHHRNLDNGQVEIEFSHPGSGLKALETGDNSLRWFSMAGSNGTYYKASASIENNRVVVWNNGIPNPEYIKYAHESNPFNVNFYNEEGLPAAPFKIRVNHPGFQIHSFKSTDYAIDKGESALLTWQVYGADEVLINQMVLDTLGGIRVWPSSDSTFTLRIHNRDQPEVLDSLSIRIYVKQPDPTISLSMDAGAHMAIGSKALITASVTAPQGGTISLVEFLVNGNRIDSITQAPYETLWVPETAGTYLITGIVTDHLGLSQVSETLSKVVGDYNTLQFEAENAHTTGRYYIREDEKASEGAYADLYRDWTITFDSIFSEHEGDYQLTVGHMLNYGSPKNQHLYLNGQFFTHMNFEAPDEESWYKQYTMIPLNEGYNKVALKMDGGPMSIDYISLLVENSATGPTDTERFSSETDLLQVYPNPFSTSTTIRLNLPEAGYTLLEVLDLSGRSLEVMINGELSPGSHDFSYDSSGLKKGIYLLVFRHKNQNILKKLMVF